MTDLPPAWDDPTNDPFEGLPAWMVNERPHTAVVEVTQFIPAGRVIEPGWEAPTTVHSDPRGGILGTWKHHVQLERDGKELTLEDRLPTWRAGERDGWRARHEAK